MDGKRGESGTRMGEICFVGFRRWTPLPSVGRNGEFGVTVGRHCWYEASYSAYHTYSVDSVIERVSIVYYALPALKLVISAVVRDTQYCITIEAVSSSFLGMLLSEKFPQIPHSLNWGREEHIVWIGMGIVRKDWWEGTWLLIVLILTLTALWVCDFQLWFHEWLPGFSLVSHKSTFTQIYEFNCFVEITKYKYCTERFTNAN